LIAAPIWRFANGFVRGGGRHPAIRVFKFVLVELRKAIHQCIDPISQAFYFLNLVMLKFFKTLCKAGV
jgi:hypothetical protein